jgi:NTP pyrophosphatase (non-canonical NTP hydrolase)
MEVFIREQVSKTLGIPKKQYEILKNVLDERVRQDQLKAQDRFKYTCADWELDESECLAVLMEEVGEVAREVLGKQGLTTDGKDGKLQTELVECAAVILAWLERYERTTDT